MKMRAVGVGCLVIVALCTWSVGTSARLPETTVVSNWADAIGLDLRKLADRLIQPELLVNEYKKKGVRVIKKKGEDIIKRISINVARMLSKKMDAVKCLYKEAERISEEWEYLSTDQLNLTYYSTKYSNSTNGTDFYESKVPSNMFKHNDSYMMMYLEPNTHFNNVSVNVTHSAVHTPTNVYDQLETLKNTITWSERMDRIFKHNYKSDPALLWQYFCSMTGMLRQFPAMRWPFGQDQLGNDFADVYDCRVRSWFIEAATCTKDVVILVDNSGSMYGMSNTIAKSTISVILSTLSNNDYVAVLNYTNVTSEVVPCFHDMLVQATPDNLRKINDEVTHMKQENMANVTTAFIAAFDLLAKYRTVERCGPNLSCNQLIMLITDGIASNITEIFEQYNWLNNGTMPIRVFTYLLGKEVTNVREIQWMACLNRGYYTHIHTQAEVPEQVLKYIAVVARPLVLHGKVHPVVWTHAYVDISDEIANTSGATGINWRDRLLTSVSIPVFDRKGNEESKAEGKKREANLLGVVGTDVPLKDIRKLTLPYKLGVNGYAFIVSNLGYVVYHPALKPDYQGELKLNFNSIDLTEVEILDDDSEPRVASDVIKKIRESLVNHTCGSEKNVKVKLHYDDWRRVTLESRDYFYAALPLTPFGIAVVLPQYGRYHIKVSKEIDLFHNPRNISDLFAGDHWGIHPDWVYCRYHYLEGHEFDTPEDELRHFLTIVGNFSKSEAERFPKQYNKYENARNVAPNDSSDDHNDNHDDDDDDDEHLADDCEFEDLAQLQSEDYEPDCGSVDDTVDDVDYQRHYNDHYCDKELMELLILDAQATFESFDGELEPEKCQDSMQVYNYSRDYGVFVRFMATQSGLTRWQTVKNYNRTMSEKHVREFAKHKRALDEAWYKGAILQNEIDSESISVTVPVIRSDERADDTVATISVGIFPMDNGLKAPAGVAGIQVPVIKFYEQFMSLTSRDSFNCNLTAVDCYLIDQNGYIVISEAKHADAGKFFGSIDINAPVMKSLIRQGLFNEVTVYDYLSVCHDTREESAATLFENPFAYTWNLVTWLLAKLIMYASQFHNLPYVLAQDEEADFSKPPKMHIFRTARPCDMQSTLYIVNKAAFNRSFTNEQDSCALPFYAHRVRYTNLILVVVITDRQSCYDHVDVTPVEIATEEPPCHKLKLNELYKRRLKHCFTQHDEEDEIESCGRASGLQLSLCLVAALTIKCLLNFL
ncbi:voltage-dependent calcium channel subunit alpha-2/delta-3 isoform X2 [Phymastichus coffea]|uniref:voltage-dependent calcium channel subunit alpha-2/delta-3 isoform X2 n=1 Tax=Phymastichus coffea TaxID=108790 RepID=UPI00273C5BEC|nr:voltage-dependent calcium channel subunit alpha-2/delta-3 isoform X2 [Phymastichus coffea]